jgi:hypothetical protein
MLPRPSYALVRVCLALATAGVVIVAVALGLWWRDERREGRDRRLSTVAYANNARSRLAN